MKTYIIPERNRLEGILITDMSLPLPRVIQGLESSPFWADIDKNFDKPPPIKTFILETVTDIAVYREKVPDDEAVRESGPQAERQD